MTDYLENMMLISNCESYSEIVSFDLE